ncbi:trypsin-like peptidase domain-containing protein [Nostoc sp. CCY 9925]|uniref:WD40 domain-containing protein n=1 Tax=Nostoc sp. CCY 9925 TaxID=3103865 RepID=UPI0039C5ED20
MGNLDLAEVQFTSTQNYRKADLDFDPLNARITVYVSGWADPDRFSIEREYLLIQQMNIRIVPKPVNEYSLVFNTPTKPGMSGGPILNEQGRLVGIHGQSSQDGRTKAVDFAGIPIQIYLRNGSQTAKRLQEQANKPASQIRQFPLPQIATEDRPINKSPTPLLQGRKISSASTNFVLWNTLRGHFLPITSISFSPNGQTLASGSRDMSIRLWNVATGTVKRTLLQADSDWIDSVAYSPDGKILASGSNNQTIKLWDVATGTVKLTLQGSFFSVHSVTFKPDGKVLASGSDDGTVKLWDVATGSETLTLQGHSSKVSSVVFSPDGKTLVSGSDDGKIKLWNVITAKEIKTIEGHSDRVDSIAFSPDGKTLASGSADNTIKLWRLSK